MAPDFRAISQALDEAQDLFAQGEYFKGVAKLDYVRSQLNFLRQKELPIKRGIYKETIPVSII